MQQLNAAVAQDEDAAPIVLTARHDLSAGSAMLAEVTQSARQALPAYGIGVDAELELINVSENATFRIVEDTVSILRVHRQGYHSVAAIESELAWLTALRHDAGIQTPVVLPGLDGRRVVQVARTGAVARSCVRFGALVGDHPLATDLERDFEVLGAVTARMHQHARQWPRPAGFTRFCWDFAAAFGTQARWGTWRHGPGVGVSQLRLLARLQASLSHRLTEFGQCSQRFGLIHADLRLANLLVAPGSGGASASVSVLDFDDCGFGWYLYDLAAALSFIEDDRAVPRLIAAWTVGYRGVAELPGADEDEIWTFIMFRRLLLLAWLGTHPVAAEAATLGDNYAQRTCDLAETFLSTHG